MSQLVLSSILSRFNTMETDTIEPSRSEAQKDERSRYKFRRHGLLGYLKQKFDFLSKSLKTQESDLLVEHYFSFTLNPLYEKTAQLPKKIFVCGYCKEPFFTPAQYFKHCCIEDCPLNHQRSTYFFTFKNQQRKIQNEDLRKKLSKKQLLTLLKTEYGKEFTFFSRQKSLIGDGTKNFEPSTDKCSICKQNILRYVKYFKSHSLLECPGRNVPQPKKFFKYLYFDQPLQRFVEEIINFHLNYNVLSTLSNSYFKIIPNNSVQKVKKYYCSHCKVDLQDEKTFLQHMIFSCNSNSNSKESQPKLRLQFTPQTTSRNILVFPDFTDFKQKYSNNRKEVVNQWQQVVNKKYEHLKQILTDIYFCGQCLNIFQTSRLYIAHCIRFNCTINHPKSSHKFVSFHGKKPLKIENFSFQSIENEFKKIIFDYQLLRKMNFTLNAKKGFAVKRGTTRILQCGKCQKQLRFKDKFLQHVLMVCLSQNHQKTNYSIEIENQQLNDEDYQKIITNHFYSMKVAECSFGCKYVLNKNEKVHFEGNYLCGSCESVFESKEEYVYHSITVCHSLENYQSSHFIKKIYNPITSICDPLMNLFDKGTKDSLQKIKEVNFQSSTHVRNPPKRRRNAKQQHQLEKIEENQQQVQTQMDQFIEQKKQKETFTEEKVQKPIQNNLQPQTSQSLTARDSERRFLRFNIDCCSLPPNTKFYCGKCQQSFKTDRRFIDHLEQICQAYQHKQSSHFYVPNKRMHEIHEKMGLFNSFEKTKSFPSEYSIYLPKKTDKFLCVCGQADFVSKLINHKRYHFNPDPHKPQHFAYLDLRIMNAVFNHIKVLFLPSFLTNTNPSHEFVCPCKPWKKLSYEEFSKHLIKRHGGKTPKFLMKMPEDKNKEIQI